jgi:hypothetical protein
VRGPFVGDISIALEVCYARDFDGTLREALAGKTKPHALVYPFRTGFFLYGEDNDHA